MATSPQALVDIAATYTVAGSPANWFLQYLTGVASALAANGDQPIPTYSVQPSADGLGLDVCQVPGGPCDVLADFVEVDGLLASFTIDGTDITGRFGTTPQPPVVAGLEFGNVIAFQRLSTDSLAIVLSLTGGDQPVQIEWAQAVVHEP